jgi:hypothetical protein
MMFYTHHTRMDALYYEFLYVLLEISGFEQFVTVVTQKWPYPIMCVCRCCFKAQYSVNDFFTHCTKMEDPQYVFRDVYQHGTVLLKILYSHHTKLGDVHCGFVDTNSDSVTA